MVDKKIFLILLVAITSVLYGAASGPWFGQKEIISMASGRRSKRKQQKLVWRPKKSSVSHASSSTIVQEKNQQEGNEVRSIEILIEESIRINYELERLVANLDCSHQVTKSDPIEDSKQLSVIPASVEYSDSDSSPSFQARRAESFSSDDEQG